jgi:hypothetical protein
MLIARTKSKSPEPWLDDDNARRDLQATDIFGGRMAGMKLREFLYVDVDRTRSLLAHFSLPKDTNDA